MFLSERDLVKKLKTSYKPICNWNTQSYNTNLLEEVNLGFGIADLVISKEVRSSSKQKQAFLNYFDLTIYKIVESKREISFESIRSITRADVYTLKKSLEKLMLESYIKEYDTIYKLKRTYRNTLTDCIAIEAKLKDWKRALNQAYRYKWFATSSYVVLDETNISKAILGMEHFEKMNVGLASIDKKGKVSILFKPKREKPIDEKMRMLLNEMVSFNHLDFKKDSQIAK